MLNDRSKGSFTEPKSQVFLLSDDNSTARIGRAVMESDGNVQLFIIDNRYLFHFLRETVKLPILHYHIIRCWGVDNLIKKCEHLEEKQNTISNSRSLRFCLCFSLDWEDTLLYGSVSQGVGTTKFSDKPPARLIRAKYRVMKFPITSKCKKCDEINTLVFDIKNNPISEPSGSRQKSALNPDSVVVWNCNRYFVYSLLNQWKRISQNAVFPKI